eukprot:TRINITY_DN91674_c0_g1_i1.p1 TRINITY_DN91674_c0_g1~~TRINITY_DN91674_c0_g1_i1.p1  ORF type:complete len:206 (+),score=66.76 TRINITY_DN91674_c0_g1_i1:105-722(+)
MASEAGRQGFAKSDSFGATLKPQDQGKPVKRELSLQSAKKHFVETLRKKTSREERLRLEKEIGELKNELQALTEEEVPRQQRLLRERAELEALRETVREQREMAKLQLDLKKQLEEALDSERQELQQQQGDLRAALQELLEDKQRAAHGFAQKVARLEERLREGFDASRVDVASMNSRYNKLREDSVQAYLAMANGAPRVTTPRR